MTVGTEFVPTEAEYVHYTASYGRVTYCTEVKKTRNNVCSFECWAAFFAFFEKLRR